MLAIVNSSNSCLLSNEYSQQLHATQVTVYIQSVFMADFNLQFCHFRGGTAVDSDVSKMI